MKSNFPPKVVIEAMPHVKQNKNQSGNLQLFIILLYSQICSAHEILKNASNYKHCSDVCVFRRLETVAWGHEFCFSVC